MSKKAALAKAPIQIPITQLDESYILVTEEKKSEILVIGRPVYIFEKGQTKNYYMGCFDIRPKMKKGILTITGHPLFGDCECNVRETESKEDYLQSIQSVVQILLKKGILYYRENDRLVKYETKKHR